MSGVVSRSLLGHRETISALAARVATERLHGVADITATEAAPPQHSSAVASLVCGSLGGLLHSSCSPMKVLLEGMLQRQRLPPSRDIYISIYSSAPRSKYRFRHRSCVKVGVAVLGSRP